MGHCMKTCSVWCVSGLGVGARERIEVQTGDGTRDCRWRCVIVAPWECVI